jgi:uncharacterized protein YbjQ (UPF0145 family)
MASGGTGPGSASQESSPRAPAGGEAAQKHRARPLHDLDFTISLPGSPTPRDEADEGLVKPAKPSPARKLLVLTTTPQVEGRRVLAYHGVVSSLALLGSEELERIETPGGSPAAATDERFRKVQSLALQRLGQEASRVGANALVGVTVQTAVGSQGLWIVCSGTAVKIESS